MNSPFQGGYNPVESSFSIDTEDGKVQLTAEELRILKQCNREGIQRRGIPFGLTFGAIAYVGAKQRGIMNHPKWGSIPIVFGSALVGYFSGRLSYFPVCYERLLNVPDGVIRQRVSGKLQGGVRPQVGQVPVQVDPRTAFVQSKPTDIDVQTTSNFDTMPSNLDSDTLQLPTGPLTSETPQRYTTYDELRERNRREYMQKMQQPGYPQPDLGFSQPGYPSQEPGYPPSPFGFQGEPTMPPGQPGIPPRQPTYQRKTRVPVQPSDPEMTPTQDSGPTTRRAKTKYGDDWEF